MADPPAATQVAVTANQGMARPAPAALMRFQAAERLSADGVTGRQSALFRERFGWAPTHPGLIAEIGDGHYFEERARSSATEKRACHGEIEQ